MRLPEQRAWDALRTRGLKETEHILLDRIENSVVDGMPDVVATALRVTGEPPATTTWIELKARTDEPARKSSLVFGNTHGLRLAQRNWILEHTRLGARVLIVARVGNKWFAFKGAKSEMFNLLTHDGFVVQADAYGMSEIFELLFDNSWGGRSED